MEGTVVTIDPAQIEQIKQGITQSSAIIVSVITLVGVVVSAIINKIIASQKNNQDAAIAADKVKADDKALIKKVKADILTQSSKTYKELITTERINWIGLLRESMTVYIANAEKLLILGCCDLNESPVNPGIEDFNNPNFMRENKEFKKKNHKIFYEFKKAEALIQLRLNPYQSNHENLVNKMHELTASLEEKIYFGNKDDIANSISDFMSACQRLLKDEWDFAKEEAIKNLLNIERVNLEQLLE